MDFAREQRAPLLFIGFGEDHVMPPKVVGHNEEKYDDSVSITEYREFPGRPHFPGVPGWEEVADYASIGPSSTPATAPRQQQGQAAALRAKKAEPVMWLVLAALGIPTWFVVGLLVGALWSRRTHSHAPGVFPGKIRTVSAAEQAGGWSRRTAYARWVHDVLLVHSGMALVRYQALPVRAADGIAPAPGVKLRGGGDPVSLRVTLDDGTVFDVATSASWAELLAGQFVALHAEPAASANP